MTYTTLGQYSILPAYYLLLDENNIQIEIYVIYD